MDAVLPDKTKIYYNVNGLETTVDISQDVLIFLHGGPGLVDHTVYIPFWTKLSALIQVVFMDMRGHGRSDRDVPENWTLEKWGGQDVYDFCEVLGIEKPIIAGISFGGWVALSYATQYPNHAKALMLCHTEAKVDIDIRKKAYAKKAEFRGQSGKAISDIVQSIYDGEIGSVTRTLYLEHCVPLYSEKFYSAGTASSCIRNTDVWDSLGNQQYAFNFFPRLSEITFPVMVITGELDPEHPPEFATAMALAIPNAKLFIVPDAGVPAYLDKEAQTLSILQKQIREWLSCN